METADRGSQADARFFCARSDGSVAAAEGLSVRASGDGMDQVASMGRYRTFARGRSAEAESVRGSGQAIPAGDAAGELPECPAGAAGTASAGAGFGIAAQVTGFTQSGGGTTLHASRGARPILLRSALDAGFRVPDPRKTAFLDLFQRKTRKNRKNPVETGLLPLTIVSESRKVNGGRFFRTRVNTGFQCLRTQVATPGVPTQRLNQATKRRKTRWQQH